MGKKEMSKSKKVFEACSSGNEGLNEENNDIVHDISQLTKMGTTPHDRFGRVLPGRQKFSVSTVKMLVGREGNYNGRGRFSSADCCHVLSRCLPTKGPSMVDKMRSCAYVSQFSEDGSLFVAGFQVPMIHIGRIDIMDRLKKRSFIFIILIVCSSLEQEGPIRIYDVDKGWKVKKNIRARSLRWTITDTTLSTDRRFLVCFWTLYTNLIVQMLFI